MNVRATLLLALALAGSTGCVTLGNMTTASALPEGESQVVLEPNLWGANGGVLPTLGLSARYGLTDTVEVGGRLGTGGFELLGKFQLTAPDAPLAISLAPSAGGFFLGASDGDTSARLGFASVSLPLLFGFKSELGELVVGPKVHDVVFFAGADTGGSGGDGSINVVSVGGTIGYAIHMGGLTVMPELALLTPLYASAGASSTDGTGDSASDFIPGESVLLQLSFAMMFGGP